MASGLCGECDDAGEVFRECDSSEYASMLRRTADLLDYVLKLNFRVAGIEQRIQEFMPHPLKSLQQLKKFCHTNRSRVGGFISSKDLGCKFRDLEELEKQASNKYPVLHSFLAQRHLIARHFLMAPALGAFAEKRKYSKQSWAFLEYSDPEERDWIARTLPRSCASTRSTAEVARLMDEAERMHRGHVLPTGDELLCNVQDLKASGVCNEEWLSDDPLALVALEMIDTNALKKHDKRVLDNEHWLLESDDECDETTDQLLKPFKKCHSLLFTNVRLVALKLLNHYLRAARFYPECLQPVQPFQRERQVKFVHSFLERSVKELGVNAWGDDHVEDVLEDAAALEESGPICSCCIGSFKAIVECSGAYSLALANLRLPELASEVLRNWKSPELERLWINIADPPFPAPVLDEIERSASEVVSRSSWLEDPKPLDYIVGQYLKAKTYGLVKKPEEYQHDDILLRTSVQVLEKAEAQLQISPEKNDAGTEKKLPVSPELQMCYFSLQKKVTIRKRWWKNSRSFYQPHASDCKESSGVLRVASLLL